MARANVRIRIRPGVVRVDVTEAAVRAVVRITAKQHQLPIPPAYRRRHSHRRVSYKQNNYCTSISMITYAAARSLPSTISSSP